MISAGTDSACGLTAVLRRDEPPGLRELLLAGALLAAVAVALYGVYPSRGAIVSDDWGFVGFYPTVGGGNASLWELIDATNFPGYKPGNNLFSPLVWWAAGENFAAYFWVGIALTALECSLFYAVLRLVGLRWAAAGTMALLLVLLPSVDATRLFYSAMHQTLAASLYLGGVAAALVGLRAASNRGRIALHGLAAVLYIAAIFTHEAFGVLIPFTAALYVVAAGRNEAWPRWFVDLGVTVVAGAVATNAAEVREGETSIGHVTDRFEPVVSSASEVFWALIPGDHLLGTLPTLLLLAALAASVAVAVRRGGVLSEAARSWAVIAAFGLAFTVIGFASLLPATDGFEPTYHGQLNRLTVPASFGEVALIAALLWLAAIAIASLVRRPRLALALAAVAVAGTAIAWARDERRGQDLWARADSEQERVLDAVDAGLAAQPRPVTGVVSFGHPQFVSTELGFVQVFQSDDLGRALGVRRDLELDARPYLPTSACDRDAFRFTAPDLGTARPSVFPYGELLFVDVRSGAAIRVASQAQCKRAVARWGAAPS